MHQLRPACGTLTWRMQPPPLQPPVRTLLNGGPSAGGEGPLQTALLAFGVAGAITNACPQPSQTPSESSMASPSSLPPDPSSLPTPGAPALSLPQPPRPALGPPWKIFAPGRRSPRLPPLPSSRCLEQVRKPGLAGRGVVGRACVRLS